MCLARPRAGQGVKDVGSEHTACVDLHAEGRDLVADRVARRSPPVHGDPVDRGALPFGGQERGDSGVIDTTSEIAGPVSSTHPVRDATSRTMTIPGADPNGQSAVAVIQ